MTHNTNIFLPISTPMIIIQQLKFNKFVILFKVKDEKKEDKGELFGRYYTQGKQVFLFFWTKSLVALLIFYQNNFVPLMQTI